MTWAKQTVIVQKTHAKDREEAKGIAKGFSDRMYTSRETGTSYRFRQKPPGHFVPGSFRVKSIPKKGVTIVYGELSKTSAFSPSGGYFSRLFGKDESPKSAPVPSGSSYSTAGVTSTNIRRRQDTPQQEFADVSLQSAVPPISYTSKYGMNFKSDYAPESFGFVPPQGSFSPPGTSVERRSVENGSFYKGFEKRAVLLGVRPKHYGGRFA